MKGILGRKLGMTQIFDPETGNVDAVTVIQAGPCPVTQVKTRDADGYDAVQLAFEPVADRKITKGELGHLKKAGVGAHRHLVEFRGASELQVGESVTVEAFEPGDRIKVAGRLDRQGLPGHDQAAQLQPRARSRTARTTSASRARSAPRPRPSRVFKGKKMAGHMGAQRASPSPASSSTRWTPSATCCSSGAPFPGPKSGLVEIRGVES